MKVCERCSIDKADTEYGSRLIDGVSTPCKRCKTCRSEVQVIKTKAKDLKASLVNDLDDAFTLTMIDSACQYCGETQLNIYPGKTDSTLGYTKANTVPMCRRCRFIRGSMPNAAWASMASVVSTALANGDFGTWDGRKK